MDSLQSEVDRVFDALFGTRPGNGNGAARRWVPAMDLAEDGEHLVLRADLPGLTEDDVEVEVKDGVLTVSGERKAQEKKEGEGFYRVERAFGSFSRSLSLPKGIDAEKVSAEFDNGVLEVRIPKPEEHKPHRVQIGTADVEGKGTEK
ncbi:MAG: Hsp20/alpha crystallin family protein [Solirubrobacterales bacterium]